MSQISVINTILVPAGMEAEAEYIRDEYVKYFQQKAGFVSSTFYRSIKREEDGAIKYINTVVWESYADFENVVNAGFNNQDGENAEGMRVLGRGFPEPIVVSPGQYITIDHTHSN